MQMLSKDLGVHQDSNSQSGNSLGSVTVHPLTLSYIPQRMKCDSRASFLAYTLASPCLGREPKARVMTNGQTKSTKKIFGMLFMKLVNENYNDWDEHLSTVLLSY